MCDPRPTAKSSLAASEIKTIDGKTRYRGENDHRREIETERRREQPPEEKWNRCSLFQPVKSSFVAYLAGADDDDVDRRGLITMIMTMTSRNDRLEWQSLRRRVNCASRNNACWISAPIIRHCVTHKTSAESDTCVSASWCSFLSLSLSPYRLSQNTCRTLLFVINVYMFAILRISIVLSLASCSDLSWSFSSLFHLSLGKLKSHEYATPCIYFSLFDSAWRETRISANSSPLPRRSRETSICLPMERDRQRLYWSIQALTRSTREIEGCHRNGVLEKRKMRLYCLIVIEALLYRVVWASWLSV